jgi:diguanylate cyclase (GGDEF)-like protein
MPDVDMPILVVDDAKFSSAIIAKALRGRGYDDVRFTSNPLQALRSLERRPARLVMCDWRMAGMAGAEFVRRVRDLDDGSTRRTHVVALIGADEPLDAEAALEANADDFLNKAQLRDELLPRVLAARRVSERHDELANAHRLLARAMDEIQTTDLIDPVTGLGNRKFTMQRLDDLLRQAEARDLAACLLTVGLHNRQVIERQYDQGVLDELTAGIAARVRQLVRPMDLVTRPEPGMFAIMMLQENLRVCTSQSFRRIFDNLYMHSFKTSGGYIPVVIGVSICAADTATGFPGAQPFLALACRGLAHSFDTGTVTIQTWRPAKGGAND